MKRSFLLFLALPLFAPTGHAYEQATHAFITRTALTASALDDEYGVLARTVGLVAYRPVGDGNVYFEFISNLVGSTAYERVAQPYEKDILDDLRFDRFANPIQTWVLFGSIREDDNPTEDPPTPQDVEAGVNRPLHHFFDPYFDRPLTAIGLGLIDDDIRKNVDWAIGARNSFEDSNIPESPRRNRYTVFDARDAMFRALTLRTSAGGEYVDLSTGGDAAINERLRQAYWATTLRAIGDILHLNQDMAQPQHTRNEPHSGRLCGPGASCLGGHTSVYEKYVDARARNATVFNSRAPFNAPLSIPPKVLSVVSYPIPAFSNYTDYWSTAPGNHAIAGMGLADYSNRGFFTAGKNFDSREYPLPSTNTSDYQIRTSVPVRWDGSVSTDRTPVHVYYGSVSDAWQQLSTPDVPLTTFGLWDQFLAAQSAQPRYSLNRLNYDAMADLLLPRAVAYSAGLINFFFRGRIDITLPDEGVFALADHSTDKGFTMLRAKIKNTTADFFGRDGSAQHQDMTDGAFFAVVRYHKDKKYVASLDTVVGAAPCDTYTAIINAAKLDASTDCRDGAEQIIVSKPRSGESLDANEQKLVEFDFEETPIPFEMTDVVLQVVYRGALGNEADAVAVGTIDVSEPTYFTYQNASDYIHLGPHVYTRGQIDSDVNLLALVQPQYCVDYRQSPPHLVDGCLDPFALDLTLSFSDLANPLALVTGLPARRFIRFAYLTVAEEDFNPPVATKAARKIVVTARRHGTVGKALLYHEGTCLPMTPFDVPARHSQLTIVSQTQAGYRVDRLDKLRGVNGWFNTSCVVNGDDAVPGTLDDRWDVMTPLTPETEEVQPYAVTIDPDYL
jgi:hypothetical protein